MRESCAASLGMFDIRAFVDKDNLEGSDHAPEIMLGSANSAPIGLAVFSSAYFEKVRTPRFWDPLPALSRCQVCMCFIEGMQGT